MERLCAPFLDSAKLDGFECPFRRLFCCCLFLSRLIQVPEPSHPSLAVVDLLRIDYSLKQLSCCLV